MKQVVAAFLAGLSLAACGPATDGYVIEGKAEGVSEGTVYLKAFCNKMFTTIDSVPLVNGKFEFRGAVEQPLLYGIATDRMKYPVQLFIENRTMKVKIAADGEKITVKNSPVNAIFLENIDRVTDEEYNIDSLVRRYPESPVTAYFLYRYFPYQLQLHRLRETRRRLSPALDSLVYVRDLDHIIESLEKVQPGCMAPGFTLPDTAGVQVSLADFRGKYVLLDFWASWCPPCRKENPNVVAAFERFKDRNFTVVGISLDKSREAWLKAIGHDKLDWPQLSDLRYWDARVAALYGIRGIPSNVLVGPDGKIIARDLRGNALPAALDVVLPSRSNRRNR